MKIVDTPFFTTPQDRLPTINVTRRTSDGVVNRVPNNNSSTVDSIASALNNPEAIIESVLKLLDPYERKQYTREFIESRLAKLTGGNLSIINNLSPSAIEALLEQLRYDTHDNNISIGGAPTSFSGGDYDRINEAVEIVNAINPEASVVLNDLQSQKVLYSEVAKQLIELGASDTVPQILTNAPVEVKQAVYLNALDTSIEKVDIATINATIESVGIDRVRSEKPQLVWVLLKNYQMPLGSDRSKYLELGTAFKTLLDALDPRWYLTTRDTDTNVFLLEPFMTASQDSIDVLSTIPELFVPTTHAYLYQQKTIRESIAEKYPYALTVK